MKNSDLTFVSVTKIYAITNAQAKKALAIARTINADITFHSTDPDGTKLSITGDDYFTDSGKPDPAAAICDIPDPEGLLGISPIHTATSELTRMEVFDKTGRWPEEWGENVDD